MKAVDFGSAPTTSFSVDSSSEIAAVTPAEQPGTVNVTVPGAGVLGLGSTLNVTAIEPSLPAPAPTRICDTRSNVGYTTECTGKALGPGGSLQVDVVGWFS